MQCARVANLKMPGDNKKAMTLWALKDAKDQGLNYHDMGSAPQVQDRSRGRLEMFKAHSRKSCGCVGENAESAESAQRKALEKRIFRSQ